MKSEDILNLFDLVRNSPEENWSYNKGRLREILHDFERDMHEAIVLDGKCVTIPMITHFVVESLQSVAKSYSKDELLYSPTVWAKIKEKLNDKVNGRWK